MKKIINKSDLIPKIQEGMQEIAAIVKRTLGPGGLPIIIERQGTGIDGLPLSPKITKDGVSVAEECASNDPEKDLVIQTVKAMCRKTNNVVGDGPQDVNSKILTPLGWKRFGALKTGDEICGKNGTTQTVLGVFPKGIREKYKIDLEGNSSTNSCLEHLWEVTTFQGRTKVLPLSELLKDYKRFDNKNNLRSKYYIKPTFVEFKEDTKALLLDPYLVGLLLGDGSLSGTGSIELSIGAKKKHIIDKIILPEGFSLTIQEVVREGKQTHYRIKIKGLDKEGNTIYNVIEKLGLLGVKSATKFIPKAYLYSSKETRLALLQGLLDIDGYVNKRSRFEFSSISKTLAYDFAELCRSLGKQVSIKEKNRANSGGYSTTNTFQVLEMAGYKYGNKIVNIEATGEFVEMQCIKVSNPDHLYITDDYIVTHNTTSSIVIGEAILNETFKALKEDSNLNPQLVKESIEEASNEVLALLSKMAKPVKTKAEIAQVATISANGDAFIGNIIGEAFEKVGVEGVVTVDEGSSVDTKLTVVEGYQFDRGAEAHSAFFNNQNRTAFVAEKAKIAIFDGNLISANDILSIMTPIAQAGPIPPLVIIANEFGPDVINWILIQKANMVLSSICLVRSPHMTSVRTEYLNDIAVMSGGTRLGQNGRSIETFTCEDLGEVERIIIDKYTTTMYNGKGSEESILERVTQLQAMKEIAESPYDVSLLNDRLSALTNGIAKIAVGGATELEVKEKYDRIEDALNAARAALQEGVVAGGGCTLLRIAQIMNLTTIGGQILCSALTRPFLQILENIGVSLEPYVIEDLLKQESLVFDARNKRVVDCFEAGIIDPVKVTKTALTNAVSVATLLATAGGGIIFERRNQ